MLGVKNVDLEIKNSNNRFYNIVLDITEERTSELEDSTIGITQNASQSYKQMVNMKGKDRDNTDRGKTFNIHAMGVPESKGF